MPHSRCDSPLEAAIRTEMEVFSAATVAVDASMQCVSLLPILRCQYGEALVAHHPRPRQLHIAKFTRGDTGQSQAE